MPLLTIRHITEYTYRQPVSFGEHRIMMRPRESFDQRLISAQLDIAPKPSELRWLHDVFGNSVAIALFDKRAKALRIASEVQLDHAPPPATRRSSRASASSVSYKKLTEVFIYSRNS